MNNIYLNKTKNFVFTNQQESIDGQFEDDLVQKWVDEHSLLENQTKDWTTTLNNNRYRVHLFHSHRGWNAALRLLSSKIMSFDELGIDKEEVMSVSDGIGLTLFCGPTGAGKSTTMNTVIDSLLQENKLGVAVSIEDPIEYLHNQDAIFQREVGKDVDSFSQGLVEAVRCTPKTIIIGEIRDSETAIEAVKAGLNGHRVFATLHASSVSEAISRLWAFLDDQGDELLVQSLGGIVAQHLINIDSNKKHLLYETLKIDDKVKNILNQVLKDGNDMAQLNHAKTTQNRLSLKDKATLFVQSGGDRELVKQF
jgi:Tfp pilus assembly pilus retraction ATPase PilT